MSKLKACEAPSQRLDGIRYQRLDFVLTLTSFMTLGNSPPFFRLFYSHIRMREVDLNDFPDPFQSQHLLML